MNTYNIDKQERYFFYNSLAILLKAVEGEQTTVDLRNESSIYGLIKQTDGYMNIVMSDCIFTDPRGNSLKFEIFFIQARNIRYVHIPSHGICNCTNVKFLKTFCINYSQTHKNTIKFIAYNPEKEISKTMDLFRFSDYDCIGFDLDSTILRYNITNLVYLEYNIITNFLIDKKGYDPEHLRKRLADKDLDFLQKGLVFDFERGNIVKLTCEGNVYSASHGTKLLNIEEINRYYPNQEWKLGIEFSKNPLEVWNGPLSLKIRTLLDCFDITAGLIFAKVVDSIDETCDKVLDQYNKIWPDILDAFTYMYSREQLKNNGGGFFSKLKVNPSKYIYKCNPEILAWIKKIKRKKKTFLITGSNSDFVELTTGYAFGEDLKSLFDIIVCYGKKPGFFTDNKSFYTLKDNYEDAIVTSNELKVGEIYNQGNWKELLEFFSRITNVRNPHCLYIGDNLLQDIYAPSKFTNCDTLVVSDEQLAEKMLHRELSASDENILNSNTWSSFFSLKTVDGFKDSFWNSIIKKHSKICVPKLDVLCNIPLDEPIKCFKQEDNDKELNGYYSHKPVSLINS